VYLGRATGRNPLGTFPVSFTADAGLSIAVENLDADYFAAGFSMRSPNTVNLSFFVSEWSRLFIP
jgi:hypothetical protein